MTGFLDVRELQYARSDQVGYTLRGKRALELVETVLADGFADPAEWWRTLADTVADDGAADRLRQVAALCEAMQL